jgi:uncharacterized protein YidB (DUF937 family)
LAQAIGPDTVNELSQQTGMPQQDLLSELSHVLPGVVDQLTPQGRLPQEMNCTITEAGERQAAMTMLRPLLFAR